MALLDLEGLRELQDSANYLLDHCPEARESLFQQGKEKCIEQVSEASLIMLDVCNVSKDVMALVRHSLQDLQLTLVFVAEVLGEVRRAIVTMVESLFSLVCVPWLETKPSKGSLSSIFTMRFCCFDDAWDEVAIQSASTRLEAAQIAVEELEVELGCIFRRLIQTRVSLLNILTAKTSPV